ncbi:MAG: 1-deoxy-D-xylulose-5-phosphate reductoisomerase [Phycisphaeraceae bacterium]|nr:MAG: 1-deoxy-D-xylulose-5-phosphate reductoisomerase [Phycisphaeraceae bacterium]
MPHAGDQPRRLVLLGSTGSIGTQTLDVVEHVNRLHDRGLSPIRFEVVALAAGSNADLLAQQADHLGLRHLALGNEGSEYTGPGSPRRGPDAAEQLVRDVDADLVVAAMVGAAGLPATLAAIELGRDVALANKETLVTAGPVMLDAARRRGVRLYPVDSEHAGVWQALAGVLEPAQAPPLIAPDTVRRVVLTASGGAFRDRTADEVYEATPEEALAHPNWSMGAKVTIDSATMVNKALELIEAHFLFGLGNDRLGVLIQRQSVVHALAELADGAIIAHLGATDMRHPIQAALTAPHTIDAHDGARLDLESLSRLDFAPVDPARFPAIDLARRVIDIGGTSGAILNAANEAAVDAFLQARIPFGRITELISDTMDAIEPTPLADLATALEADRRAREHVEQCIAGVAWPRAAWP